MALYHRKPHALFGDFETRIHGLVQSLLPVREHIRVTMCKDDETRAVLSFHGPHPIAARVRSAQHGELHLWLEQRLQAVRHDDGRHYALHTESYRYRLQASNDPRAKALVRWEFDPRKKRQPYPPQHLHVLAVGELGDRRCLDFDRLHLPTGRVTIESLIRFLITDLEVQPKVRDWKQRLRNSEKEFQRWLRRH